MVVLFSRLLLLRNLVIASDNNKDIIWQCKFSLPTLCPALFLFLGKIFSRGEKYGNNRPKVQNSRVHQLVKIIPYYLSLSRISKCKHLSFCGEGGPCRVKMRGTHYGGVYEKGGGSKEYSRTKTCKCFGGWL